MDTAMPLQLLQPLDGANPASTPVRLSGPEQRLTVNPDPGVGDESLLPPSQLLIVKDGESRSIWPVHLARSSARARTRTALGSRTRAGA